MSDNNEIPDIYNLDYQQSFDESQIFYNDYCDPPFEDDYSQVCEYEDF